MPIVLNHTIVPVRDKAVSARFFAAVLGLTVGPQQGPFVPVAVNADLTFDFDDGSPFEPHHYAFLVDDVTFDLAVERLRKRGTPIGSDPSTGWDGRVCRTDTGKRVYFCDDNGHVYELFTGASS